MAYMSICRACEAPVAKNAKECPSCGCKRPSWFQRSTNKPKRFLYYKLTFIICISTLFLIFGN